MEMIAREDILREHMGLINSVCRRYLRDTEESREMAQEVAVRILSTRSGFEGESLPSTWVFAVARNVCLMKLKKQSSERRRLPSYATHLEAQEAGRREAGPELRARFSIILEGVDEVTRKILLLYAEQGLSHGEIGLVMGVSRVAIHQRLVRLRRRLHDGRQARKSGRRPASPETCLAAVAA